MKLFPLKSVAIAVCATLLTTTSAFAANAEIDELKKRIEQLEKKQQNVKIKLTGGGVKITDKKSDTSFKINGRMHFDVDAYDGAYNAKNGGDTASDAFIRRARLGISGHKKDWHYKLTLAFGGDAENGRLQNAILSYKGFKNTKIQIGKSKEDITLAGATSSNHLTALSRPMIANAVSPFFNWGVRVDQHYKDSGLRYSLGVYQAEDNGFGSANGRDPESGKTLLAYTGRLNWSMKSEKDSVLHLGAWGSHRDFGGNTLKNRLARGEVRNTNVRLLDYAAGGSKINVDKINQYGVEFAKTLGPLSIQAEYVKRTVDASTGSYEPDLTGYYGTVSYFLTGESRRYSAAQGVFKQPKGVSGAWEVHLQHSAADSSGVNNGVAQGTDVDINSIGVTYYVNPQLRFMVNYLNADVKGSQNAVNALVGKESDGNAFTFRAQYLF